jgi:acyl-coenzyme A synthetase/AMP-(fatty) acid ligase
MNLLRPILHYGRTQPNAPALVEDERVITYRELAQSMLRTAGHLAALGVKPGDALGLCLKDRAEHMVALLAAGWLGALAVPIDWRARPAERIRVAQAFALKLLLIEAGEAIETACPLVPIDAAWSRAVADAQPLANPSSDWNAPFVVSPTSGTTGATKFILSTHLQYLFSSKAWLEAMALPQPCRFLSIMPLYFSGGRRVGITHLLRGDCVILYPPLFSAGEYVAVLRRHRATASFVVPSVIRQLLQIAREDELLLPEMDALCVGGAPLFAEEKRAAARKLTPNFYDCYNIAANGPVARLRPADIHERADSVGQPNSLTEVEVVDEDGRALAPGAVGRLRVRGPSLGSGIAGPSGSEAAGEGFRDGWYYTGELAALDELGYIYLKGRSSEVIFRGGAKIHPEEIEAVLLEHEAVAEAAVLGRALPDNEQAVTAFVVPLRPVEASELMAHCRIRLAPYKLPQEIHLVAKLPRTSSGKVDKAALARLPEATARGTG